MFGPRKRPKRFHTLMVFRKDFFLKSIIYFEGKNQQAQKRVQNYPVCKALKKTLKQRWGTSSDNFYAKSIPFDIFKEVHIEGRFWAQCSQKLKYMQRIDI